MPAPLDFGCATQSPITDVLPELTLRTAAPLAALGVQNAKSTRAYLKRVGRALSAGRPIQQQTPARVPREAHKKGDHGGKDGAVFNAKALLGPGPGGTRYGHGRRSPGMPAVADPRQLPIVRAAHDAGIAVVPS